MIYIEGYFVSGVFAMIMLKASYPDALSSVYHHFSVRFRKSPLARMAVPI